MKQVTYDRLAGMAREVIYVSDGDAGERVKMATEWCEGLEAEGIPELWDVRSKIDSLMSALRVMRTAVDDEIGHRLDGASVRLGDRVLAAKPKGQWKVLDPDALFGFIEGHERECFPADAVRITSLRAVAELKAREEMDAEILKARRSVHDDPEAWVKHRVQVIVNSLMDYEKEDVPTLQVLPLTRAPKWAQGLEEGKPGYSPRAQRG